MTAEITHSLKKQTKLTMKGRKLSSFHSLLMAVDIPTIHNKHLIKPIMLFNFGQVLDKMAGKKEYCQGNLYLYYKFCVW